MSYEMIEDLVEKEQERSGGTFISGISLADYLGKIKSQAEIVAHYVEGKCAGFVAFYCNDLIGKNAFITLVLVAPEFRGKKVSQSLINYVLSLCKIRKFDTCSLEVLSENSPAIKVYEKIGFNKAEEREGRITMRITLN